MIVKMQQSNAGGQPEAPTVREPSAPRADIPTRHGHLSWPSNFQHQLIEPLHYHADDPAYVPSSTTAYYGRQGTGGEVELGVRLKDVHGRACGIVTSWAGATGAEHWRPTDPTGLTSRAIGYVDETVEILAAQGIRAHVAAVVYTGGEQDATSEEWSSVYEDSLNAFAARWRARYGAGLVIVIDRIRDDIDRYAPWLAAVIAGETAFLAGDELAVGVDNSSTEKLPDNLHYSPDGLASKGKADADAIASLPAYAPTTATHVIAEIYDDLPFAQNRAAQFSPVANIRKSPVDLRWAVERGDGRHWISKAGWPLAGV